MVQLVPSKPTPVSCTPATRHSKQKNTPIRTDPNFIRPSDDSRTALRQTFKAPLSSTSSEIPNGRQIRAKSQSTTFKKRIVKKQTNPPESECNQPNSQTTKQIMDLTQDSDIDNKKIKRRKTKSNNYDDVYDFFEKPTMAEGQVFPSLF